MEQRARTGPTGDASLLGHHPAALRSGERLALRSTALYDLPMKASRHDFWCPTVVGVIWLGFGLWSTLRGESNVVWFGLGAASLLQGLLFVLERRQVVTGRGKAIWSFAVAAGFLVFGVGSVLADVSVRTYWVWFALCLAWLLTGIVAVWRQRRSGRSSSTEPSEAAVSGP